MRVLPPIFLILSVAQAAACSLINAPDDPAMPESRTSCDGGACESDDPCEVCAPEARCARIDGGAVCTCPEDHEDPRGDGTRCHPLQECRPDADDCAGGRVCVEDGGGASCRCPDGHEGAGEECRDVDECAERLHDCSPAARCVNTEGAFRCRPTIPAGSGEVVIDEAIIEKYNRCQAAGGRLVLRREGDTACIR